MTFVKLKLKSSWFWQANIDILVCLGLPVDILTHCYRPWKERTQSWINNFQTHIKDGYPEYFQWNYSQECATRPHWWLVNIGSGNGLIGALRQQAITWTNVDPHLCRHMASLGLKRRRTLIVCNFWITRWRHQMKTFSASLTLCEGNPPVDSSHKSQWRRALMFLWSAPEEMVEQTIETPVIWDAIALSMTSP